MGRHKGDPTPWVLLTEAAIAYANAESDKDFELATYRLRYAAKHYRDNPGSQGPEHISAPVGRVMAGLATKVEG